MFDYKKFNYLVSEKNLTREDLARQIGVSIAMVSYIARGLKVPSFSLTCRIADALDIEISELRI